ncbi:fimbrial protein [Klebsiella indica]|uniref:Type 1 fimbrial protein n=1 Tax=Klebsiella indica TaxID=2582917 RepID=A0A5R9L8W5_9ENTR|nr:MULTISPECIES: fimbrial protein [Klebsiella]TLV05902.1 type 1 fimbrial protein [Klebsiella indica]
MKMKLLAIAVPALFMASSVLAAEGDGSTINFTGNIVEQTCSLADISKDQTVILGDVAASTFTGSGSVSTEAPFTITLEDCPLGTNDAVISFTGNIAGFGNTAMSTDDIDTTGVGVQILDDSVPVSLSGTVVKTLTEGTNELEFAARYVAMGEKVKAGSANATANFTVSYQ